MHCHRSIPRNTDLPAGSAAFLLLEGKAGGNQRRGNPWQGKDFVKIADAKFPYNPFPEISEFLSRRDQYLLQLEERIEKKQKDNRRSKLAYNFIKAALQKKFESSPLVWHLEESDSEDGGFVLILGMPPEEKRIPLSEENFMKEISVINLL